MRIISVQEDIEGSFNWILKPISDYQKRYLLSGKMPLLDVPENAYEETENYKYALVYYSPKIYEYTRKSGMEDITEFGKEIRQRLIEVQFNKKSHAMRVGDVRIILEGHFPNYGDLSVVHDREGYVIRKR